MITVTGRESNTSLLDRFPQLGNSSNTSKLFLGRERSNTRFFAHKKYIVLSARVHPSEVASSYVLKSLLHFFLKERKRHTKRYTSI